MLTLPSVPERSPHGTSRKTPLKADMDATNAETGDLLAAPIAGSLMARPARAVRGATTTWASCHSRRARNRNTDRTRSTEAVSRTASRLRGETSRQDKAVMAS